MSVNYIGKKAHHKFPKPKMTTLGLKLNNIQFTMTENREQQQKLELVMLSIFLNKST